MKILYFFAELDTPMYQWQRTHIIDELSHHSIEIVTFNPLCYESVGKANEEVIREVKKGGYDLFLSSICYHKFLYVNTLTEIKRIGIPTLVIIWDNLMVPYIDKVLAPHFDLVWLTSKETERLYEKWGVKYFFAPYAANPFTFVYKESTLKRSACFIGNPHGSRSIMINTLTSNKLPVELYYGGNRKKEGAGLAIHTLYNTVVPSTKETLINRIKFAEGRKLMWGSIINKIKGATSIQENNYLIRHDGLLHSDMVKTYSSSVLSLAATSAGHTDVLKKPLPIINLRNFEIPMCGGIEICKYNEELASYFDDGKEIIFYHTEDELVDKSRYYIEKATDKEVYSIKRAARDRSKAEHTWMNRFEIAFNKLGLHY